jgi:protoheme IX farnesyltransferase
MMPVIKGEAYTKKQIILYSILMLVTVAMPYFLNMANMSYLVISSIMSVIFLYHTFLLFDDSDFSKARKLFWFSILYLFIIFLSLIIFKI